MIMITFRRRGRDRAVPVMATGRRTGRGGLSLRGAYMVAAAGLAVGAVGLGLAYGNHTAMREAQLNSYQLLKALAPELPGAEDLPPSEGDEARPRPDDWACSAAHRS